MKICGTKPPLHTLMSRYAMSKNDSLNGTTLPLRKIRQRESAVPKHRYRRYQIADIITYYPPIDYLMITFIVL